MLDESYPERFRTLCQEAGQRGWRRVIMLGDDLREGPYTLKACLAQAGVMVFVPGPRDRMWLQGLADGVRAGEVPNEASLARLAAMLAEGMEHGVNGLVVTDPAVLILVRTCANGAPIFDVTEV